MEKSRGERIRSSLSTERATAMGKRGKKPEKVLPGGFSGGRIIWNECLFSLEEEGVL